MESSGCSRAATSSSVVKSSVPAKPHFIKIGSKKKEPSIYRAYGLSLMHEDLCRKVLLVQISTVSPVSYSQNSEAIAQQTAASESSQDVSQQGDTVSSDDLSDVDVVPNPNNNEKTDNDYDGLSFIQKINNLCNSGLGATANKNIEKLYEFMESFFEFLEKKWVPYREKCTRQEFAHDIIAQCPDCRLWATYWQYWDSNNVTQERWNSLILQYILDSADYFKKNEIMEILAAFIEFCDGNDDAAFTQNFLVGNEAPLLYVLRHYGSAQWISAVLGFLLQHVSTLTDSAKEDLSKTIFHCVAICCDDVIADFLLDELTTLLHKNKTELLNTRDNKGFTPLHVACLHGNVDVVNWLFKQNAGVDANAKANGDIRPLHCATGGYYKDGTEPVSVLKKDQSDYQQQIERHKQIIDLLLTHHADVNACDIYKLTAHDYAKWQGQKPLATYLLLKSLK